MAFSMRILGVLALAAAAEAAGMGMGSNLNLRGGGKHFPKMPDSIRPGVLYGQEVKDLLNHAKENCYAIPAVNCVTSSSVNTVLEAAKKFNSPVMIQFSNGGAQFYAGKTVDSPKDTLKGCVLGSIAGALHVKQMAEHYGVPVILHSDHCAKKLLPWFDGMLEADEKHFKEHGTPLFSSHMLDLSEEELEDNVGTCVKYLERMAKVDLLLEMELGVTGGEEDGVDNSDVDSSRLYTQPEEVWEVYKALSAVPNGKFTVAAAFGNVHGVYAPGNVDLQPVILHNTQKYIKEQLGTDNDKPVSFVFHGGSGSSREDIRYAIEAGTIKMNIDTDTQWAFWDGMREYEAKNRDYLQAQIGNPEGADKPNKKYYDPRMALRAGEESMAKRLGEAMEDLNCIDVLG
jgi:fructose-bisphosphate aldolase class II